VFLRVLVIVFPEHMPQN